MQCPACGAALADNALICDCGESIGPVAERPASPLPFKGTLRFRGEGGALFVIKLVNFLLSLITLGFYFFWAKVKVRKFFYGQTEFEGDRFVFHGTGGELLRGWMIIAAFFIVIGVIAGVLEAQGVMGWVVIVRTLQIVVVLILLPVAMVGSRRYRLSRSSWRGIRFSFRGRAKEFFWIFFRDIFLTGLTLFIYSPVMNHNFRQFFFSHSYFGNRRFDYDGDVGELFWLYVKGFLLTLFTLGIYSFWFSAETQRYYWQHTTFGAAPPKPDGEVGSLDSTGSPGQLQGNPGVGRFGSTVTGGGMLVLGFTNILLFLVTVGFAYPWIEVRSMRYIFENLHLEGPVDLEAIQQEAQEVSASGEGMAEYLDVGPFDIDLGF